MTHDPHFGPAQRLPLVAGNWKMNLVRWEADALCRKLLAALPLPTEVVLFPSFPLLPGVVEALAGSGIGVGGQDLHREAKGAHTGDVSGLQLADVGCSWALCGHSERRQNHGEGDELAVAKALAAVRAGLKPLLCVGETGAERGRGETLAVLDRQLAPLAGLDHNDLPGLVLASLSGRWAPAKPPPRRSPRRPTPTSGAIWRRFGGARARPLEFSMVGLFVTPDNSRGLAAMPGHHGGLVGGGASLAIRN